MEYSAPNSTISKLKKFCRNYSREVVEISIRSILLLIGTTILNLVLLYFYSILCHMVSLTYSGQKFIMRHPNAANLIADIGKNDLIEASIHTTFSAFTICILICAICQVFHITRYFYYPRNVLTKLLFWGLPLTGVLSMYANDQLNLAHWSYTIPITIVPTLCVFTYCFRFTATLLPEIGAVIMNIFTVFRNWLGSQPAPITNENTPKIR